MTTKTAGGAMDYRKFLKSQLPIAKKNTKNLTPWEREAIRRTILGDNAKPPTGERE